MGSQNRWQAGGATCASEQKSLTLCVPELLTNTDREDQDLIEKSGKCKAFHTGSNFLCHQHLHQHYEIYQKRCKEAKIEEHHWAIPRQMWQEVQEKKGKQGKLDGIVVNLKLQVPQVFTCEGLCHAVSQFIACNDQVSITYLSANIPLNIDPLDSRWQLQARPHSETV
jgi:hypothetical protein